MKLKGGINKMEREIIKVSLDCDGVIANNFLFFEETLEKNYGVRPNKTFYKDLKIGNFSNYEQEQGLPRGEITNFLKGYEAFLFENLGKLKPMEGVREGITNFLEKGYQVMMNSYRPNEYKGKKQDTQGLTLEWLAKNNIPVDRKNVHLAGSKDEKVRNIFEYLAENYQGNKNNYRFHIDDDTKILKKIKEADRKSYKESATPIWLENPYNDEKHFPKEVCSNTNWKPIPSEPMNFAENWREVNSTISRNLNASRFGYDILMCAYVPNSVRLNK